MFGKAVAESTDCPGVVYPLSFGVRGVADELKGGDGSGALKSSAGMINSPGFLTNSMTFSCASLTSNLAEREMS